MTGQLKGWLQHGLVETVVVYLSQNFSIKSSGKVNGTQLFGLFQQNIFRPNVTGWTSEKVVLFFLVGMFQREICVPFVKSHLDTSFRPSQSFFGKGNWFVQMVNVLPRQNLPVWNFAYHLPKLWTNYWFVQ